MEKQQFNISIDAPKEKVWNVLWDDASYRQWTYVFSPGSWADTDWKKGSRVLFLNEKNEGMISEIAENIPNEFMSIRHLGMVMNGVQNMDLNQAGEWGDALENYTLKDRNGKTELIVDMNVADEYKDYFRTTWPKALEKVKELAEGK